LEVTELDQTAMDVSEVMTTPEVSTEFKIPVGTLRYYRSAGSGPASFRLAGRVRYRRADVLAWVAQQEQATRRGGITL
jgi:DNA-binding transcriptional MerR regulator